MVMQLGALGPTRGVFCMWTGKISSPPLIGQSGLPPEPQPPLSGKKDQWEHSHRNTIFLSCFRSDWPQVFSTHWWSLVITLNFQRITESNGLLMLLCIFWLCAHIYVWHRLEDSNRTRLVSNLPWEVFTRLANTTETPMRIILNCESPVQFSLSGT